jgi:hypothetical protein
MAVVDNDRVKLKGRSHVSIVIGGRELPIEVTVTGQLPPGTGSLFVENALLQQSQHAEFIDEYNEPSAVIGKTDFDRIDHTAVYTFGVDKRDLVFHRHKGHRVITGITGGKGCILKFSLCSPSDARKQPELFWKNLYIVQIPGDRQFVLRFSGTIYHQFCPASAEENGFFAISVHTNEATGLSGELLQTVLNNKGNIALLTEPAPPQVLSMVVDEELLKNAIYITLDCEQTK